MLLLNLPQHFTLDLLPTSFAGPFKTDDIVDAAKRRGLYCEAVMAIIDDCGFGSQLRRLSKEES